MSEQAFSPSPCETTPHPGFGVTSPCFFGSDAGGRGSLCYLPQGSI